MSTKIRHQSGTTPAGGRSRSARGIHESLDSAEEKAARREAEHMVIGTEPRQQIPVEPQQPTPPPKNDPTSRRPLRRQTAAGRQATDTEGEPRGEPGGGI